MDGTNMVSSAVLWTGDSGWVPIAAADFNSDGRPTSSGATERPAGRSSDGQNDIVWRNSNDGRVIIWLMNGNTMTSAPPIWQ